MHSALFTTDFGLECNLHGKKKMLMCMQLGACACAIYQVDNINTFVSSRNGIRPL
jgi:hypothetical protein